MNFKEEVEFELDMEGGQELAQEREIETHKGLQKREPAGCVQETQMNPSQVGKNGPVEASGKDLKIQKSEFHWV